MVAALCACVAACGKASSGSAAAADAGVALREGGAAIAAPTGCLPRRLRVTEVTVGNELGWLEGVPHLQPKRVEAVALEKLAGTPIGGAGGGTLPATLKVRIGAAPGEDKDLVIAISLELRWEAGEDACAEGGRFDVRVAGQRKPPDGVASAAFVDATLERTMVDAVTTLVRRDGIRRGDAKLVAAALDDEDPEVREDAVRAVGDRQLHEIVPRLIQILDDPDPERADAALGALVALHEEGAVKAIVEHVQFRDVDRMRRVIDAVAEIGGDEADAYLDMVAGGHDVPGVRDLAKNALDRMRLRKARKAH